MCLFFQTDHLKRICGQQINHQIKRGLFSPNHFLVKNETNTQIWPRPLISFFFFFTFLYWFFMYVHFYPCREKEDSSCLLDKKWVDRLYDLIILSKCFLRPFEVIFICSNWFFLSFVQLNNINNSKLYSFSHFAMKNIHVCVLFICVLVCKKLIKEYLKKILI